MPTNRFYPAGQSASAEFAFHHWITAYMEAFLSVKPIMRAAGLMEEFPTPGKNYHVHVPRLGLSRPIFQDDGQDWPTSRVQGSEVTGVCTKRGPEGILFDEDDLLETQIPIVTANVSALGRTESLFEDGECARALEDAVAGKSRAPGNAPITGFDNKPIFAPDHPTDPVSGKGKQSNVYNLDLTADAVLQIIQGFRSYVTESGDPVFQEEPQFSLVYPPNLQAQAEKALDREYIAEIVPGSTTAASVSNTAYKRLKPVCVPQLSDVTRWYVAVNNMARKPLARVIFRAMRRFQLGPESDLWKSKQQMKIYSNEKTDCRVVDYRLIATSKKGP